MFETAARRRTWHPVFIEPLYPLHYISILKLQYIHTSKYWYRAAKCRLVKRMAGNLSDQKGEKKEKIANILCAKEASALLNAIIDKDFDKKDQNWQETVWDLALKLRDCARRQVCLPASLSLGMSPTASLLSLPTLNLTSLTLPHLQKIVDFTLNPEKKKQK